MKILYITSSFSKKGSASIRNIALVNGLIENGLDVDVLTQHWPQNMLDNFLVESISEKATVYYDKINIIEKYFSIKEKTHKESENIPQWHKKLLNNKLSKFLKASIMNYYYFPGIDKQWMKTFNRNLNFEEYDLIISSSDTKTSHFIANTIVKNIHHTHWYQYWGDPWVDDAGTKGIRKLRASFNESHLLRKGDKIFYSSLPTMKAMQRKYILYSEKMNYLPRPFLNIVRAPRYNTNKFTFTYAGSIYYGRNIMPLVENIKEYNKINTIKIQLKIFGTYDNQIKDKLSKYEFIELNDYKSYEEIIKITEESDVMVLLGNMKGSHQIPGKLYDYFGSNKSILALVEDKNDDVTKFIISTRRCTVFLNKYEEIDLKKVIDDIGTFQSLKEYSKENVAKYLIQEFNQTRGKYV